MADLNEGNRTAPSDVWPVGTKVLVRGAPAVIATAEKRGDVVYEFRDEDGQYLTALTENSRWWCLRDD